MKLLRQWTPGTRILCSRVSLYDLAQWECGHWQSFSDSEIQQLLFKEGVGRKEKNSRRQKSKTQLANISHCVLFTISQGLYSDFYKTALRWTLLYPFSWWEDQSLILARKWRWDLNLAVSESQFMLSLKFQIVFGYKVQPVPSGARQEICYFEKMAS